MRIVKKKNSTVMLFEELNLSITFLLKCVVSLILFTEKKIGADIENTNFNEQLTNTK